MTDTQPPSSNWQIMRPLQTSDVNAQPQPTSGGWRAVRALTGVTMTGQPVGVLTGVVQTPEGPAPALLVGVCAIVVDTAFVADLLANLQQATESARTGGGDEW